MQTSRLGGCQRAGRDPDEAMSTDNVGTAMNVTSRTTRQVLVAATLALVVAGCGGTDEPVAGPSPAATSETEGGALAGVQFDVRRDPG